MLTLNNSTVSCNTARIPVAGIRNDSPRLGPPAMRALINATISGESQGPRELLVTWGPLRWRRDKLADALEGGALA